MAARSRRRRHGHGRGHGGGLKTAGIVILAVLLSAKAPGANATVTLCHTGTRGLSGFTRQADVLVAAAGRPAMITPEMVKPGAAVVDVGHADAAAGGPGDLAAVALRAARRRPAVDEDDRQGDVVGQWRERVGALGGRPGPVGRLGRRAVTAVVG